MVLNVYTNLFKYKIYIVNDKVCILYGVVKYAATKDYMQPSEKKATIPMKNYAYIENITPCLKRQYLASELAACIKSLQPN